MKNLITDIDGLLVGNASDDKLKSGTTTLVCDRPMVASYAVLGGAPGTRDTDLLHPDQTVESIDAITLSGGSAFGLDAAGGVQGWLKQQGRGFAVGPVSVPIVPAAILFDLANGGDKNWGKQSPYWELGWRSAEAAGGQVCAGKPWRGRRGADCRPQRRPWLGLHAHSRWHHHWRAGGSQCPWASHHGRQPQFLGRPLRA